MSRPKYPKKGDQIFVYPWKGIIANISTKVQDGRLVGESGRRLRDELTGKGFNPLKVHPLWSRYGHSGFAIVEFNKEWDGFNNAIMFEKSFDVVHCGKKDYYSSRRPRDELFGWVAREEDYHSSGVIGEYLRKNGDLKTVSGKEAEDQRKNSKLVTTLANTLETKSLRLKEMETKYDEASESISKLMEQKDEMTRVYNEENKKMQQIAHDHFEKIYLDHQRTMQHLYDQNRALEQHERELLQRKAQNEAEAKKLHHEKMMNARATMEQKKADESMLRLAELQKTEKEKLHRKIIELERQIDAKQALELEIQQLTGSLQVMQHIKGDEDTDMKRKMEEMQEELREKEEEYEGLEDLNQALIVKERNSNDELQGARKELINSLKDAPTRNRAFIGVKKMGDLDMKPFLILAKRKYSAVEADEKAAMLCSKWQAYLRDPSWHPFKVLTDKEGNSKEILNEEDAKLIAVKTGYGDEVYNAVRKALKEMNEHNPSGRYIVPELWNFNEGRKAKLTEGVEYLLKQWKLHKRKKH